MLCKAGEEKTLFNKAASPGSGEAAFFVRLHLLRFLVAVKVPLSQIKHALHAGLQKPGHRKVASTRIRPMRDWVSSLFCSRNNLPVKILRIFTQRRISETFGDSRGPKARHHRRPRRQPGVQRHTTDSSVLKGRLNDISVHSRWDTNYLRFTASASVGGPTTGICLRKADQTQSR